MEAKLAMAHIFVSYRSLEKDFALQLAQSLQKQRFEIWMDVLSGIRAGEDWRQTLQIAINECSAMIVVLSPDYVHSKYCLREMMRADELSRPIIPIILKPVDKTEFPLALQGTQHVDFRDWRNVEIYESKLAELVSALVKMGLNRSEVGVTTGSSITTAPPPLKQAEDTMLAVSRLIGVLQPLRRSIQLRVSTLQKELQIAERDYEAVSQEFFSTLDPRIKNALDRQMQDLLQRIDRIEDELKSINHDNEN